MLAALLALLASAGWGVADFGGGVLSRRLPVVAVIGLVQVSGLAVLAVAIALRGVGPVDEALVAGAASGVLGVFAFGLMYRALAIGTMGVVAPILAASAAVPVAAGVIAGERPGAAQAVAAAVAAVGVLLAARAPGVDGHGASRGIGIALLAMLILGVQLVLIDAGADRDAWWTIAASRSTSCALALAALVVLRPAGGRPVRRDWPLLAGVGIVDTGANLSFASATALGLLSIVAVLGSLAPVATTALARVRLGERLSAAQAAGVALALAGVVGVVATG